MAAGTTNFPAFLQLNYEENGVNARFESDIRSMTQSAEQRFKTSFSEISAVIDKALQPSNFSGLGKLDLGTSKFRQAAAEARLYKESIAATLRTASALAIETGDTTRETELYIQALEAQNKGARDAVQSAEAQVATYTRLQTALDITAAKSSKLAAAQRELYAEQAAAARIEVSQRNAQNSFTQFAAPNLSRSAIDNGATTSALAQRVALDELSRSEAAAAEGARLLATIQVQTGLALDRTAKSARDSAQAFIQADAAQQKLTGETNELRAALDPMFAAQQRFDQELARADRLYQKGAISTREYAQAQQLARQNIRSASDAIQQQAQAQRQGTTVGGMVVNSLGSQRFAMIQVGQQLQDITVGFASGQRAATIFAQQLPQLGFALTGFNGKLGALGRLLAGPAGVAIFAAVTVASFALTKAFESNEDSASESERAQRSLTEVLKDSKSSYEEVTDALRAYNKEQENSREITLLASQEEAKAIETRLRMAIATKQALLNQIELNFEQARYVPAGPGGEVNSQAISETFELKKRIEQLKKEIALETKASENVVIDIASQIAEINTDPTVKIRTGFELLRQEATKTIKDVDKLSARLTALKNQENAALDAVKESTRKTSTSERDTRTRQQVLADFTRELEQRGIDVISGYRSAAKQNSLFKQGLTPADGYKIPSRHQSYRALDVDKKTFDEQKAYEAAQAAGLRGFRILTESGGRKHLDFTGSGKPGTVDEKADKNREREAKAAARETSRLAAVSDQAAESIARINEQYDEQPRLVDRAAQSTRKLDNIIAELSDPKNAGTPRLKELIAEAQEARALAANAVNTEISRYGEENEKNLEIMSLQAAGLFDQADILQEINRLDERLGLSSALEKLAEQKIEAEGILQDEQSTNDERAAALSILEKTAQEMAKIRGQQTEIANEARDTHQATKDYAQQISRVNDALNDQLSVVSSIEQSITGLLGGKVSGKDFLKDIRDTFGELQAKTTFRNIFGDAFDQIEAQLNSDTPLGKANSRLVKEVDQTARSANDVAGALDFVAEAANAAASKLQGITNPQAVKTPNGANDNEIVVTAIRDQVAIENRSVSQLADAMASGIVGPLAGSLNEIFGTKFTQQLTGALSSALSGYLQGGEVGGVLGGLQGITKILGDEGVLGKGIAESISKTLGSGVQGAGTGTQVAGIAKALGLGNSFSTTGSQIGGAIGSVIPIPGGEIIGSVIGGFLGGLFKKKPAGQAGVTSVDGDARISSNKSAVAESLGSLTGQLQQSLKNIAEQLDAEIGAFSVSIGQREDYFRVAGSASTDTGQKNTTGFLYDGKDPEQALRIAILDALQDGAIQGVREGTKRLLQSGKDLDAALQDALSFENVFKRLKAYKDPVGAALDALDKEFNKLVDIFNKAGASAQEYAELEELYGIERAQAIKEASERITGSLRDLFRDLTIGDSGLSLRTRLGNAQAEYDPLAQRVASGDITAYDDYADAARNLLDLQREVYGSSEDYFRLLDEVTQLTKTRIDEESNIASLAVDRDTPFSVDQTPVVNAISFQNGLIQYQTDLLASYLAAIAKNSGVTVSSGTGGGNREPINRNVANF
ncbi:phage tail length tape measure family protein [Parasphingorhabdus sp.]|uniref:phage tail length tape measure family protein n=1 Tax=Parasphingorhabdus sp. TaxID=2709688 RepID=UPI003A954C6C